MGDAQLPSAPVVLGLALDAILEELAALRVARAGPRLQHAQGRMRGPAARHFGALHTWPRSANARTPSLVPGLGATANEICSGVR